jgi:tRNA 2-thiouridine synthesizing protein A
MTTATETLDTKGMNCPMPILKTKKSIKKLNIGDTLEIFSTDPGSVRDFASFCKATGNELLESGEDAGVYRYLIRRN